MALLKTALISTLLLYSSNSYSPSPTDYLPLKSELVNVSILWGTCDTVPGYHAMVMHKNEKYICSSTGEDADLLRQILIARTSAEINFPTKRMFERIVPITIDDVVSINGQKIIK